MALKLITAPALEPISLAEARAQCHIDGTDEDALLTIYIQSARQHAEGLIDSALITQTWEQTLDAFPTDEIKLGKPPVLSVTSVKYINTAGTEITLASNQYVLDSATSPGWLLPADGYTWPDTNDVANAVRIQYATGFGPLAADVPAPIRSWMLLTIALLYAQREAADLGGKSTAIPSRFVDSLLDPFRQYAL